MSLSSYMRKYLTTIQLRHYEQYRNEIIIITGIKEHYKQVLKFVKKHFKNRYEVIKNNGVYTIRTFEREI